MKPLKNLTFLRKFSGFKVEKKTDIKKVFGGEDIVLKDVLNIFVERRVRFIVLTVICLILSITSISLKGPVFESKTTIIPEINSQVNRRARGLASIAGINVQGNSQSSLESPGYFPAIVRSELFLAELLEEKFKSETYRKRISLMEFFFNYRGEQDIVVFWMGSLIKGKLPRKKPFRKSNDKGYGQSNYREKRKIAKLTSQQRKAISKLRKSIDIVRNEDNNLTTIMVTSPEKKLSAFLADLVTKRMIDFAVTHQTEKEKTNLKFIRNRRKIAKREFEDAHKDLAQFLDRNQNSISASVLSRQELLKTELQIKSRVYSSLAVEVEQAELELKEQTPVYTVFQGPIEPNNPKKQSNIQIILIYLVFGLLLAFISVVVKIIFVLAR